MLFYVCHFMIPGVCLFVEISKNVHFFPLPLVMDMVTDQVRQESP